MTRTWLVVPLLALVTAGCAGPAVPPGAPSQAPASQTPASQTPASQTPASSGCVQGALTLTEADNGRTVCVATGTTVDVYLHETGGRGWSKPVADQGALRPAASGKGALPVGVSAGFFVAAGPGQARITAQQAACGTGPKPGPMCEAIVLFAVTVTVA